MMNTHILSDVEMICDRVGIIVGGRMAYEGAIDEFQPGQEKMFDVTLAALAPDFVDEMATRLRVDPSGRLEEVVHLQGQLFFSDGPPLPVGDGFMQGAVGAWPEVDVGVGVAEPGIAGRH